MPKFRIGILAALAALCMPALCEAADRPLIFPAPKVVTLGNAPFLLDGQTVIVLPTRPSEQDLFLSNALADELGDRFAVHPKTERVTALTPGRPMVLIGAIAN